MKKLNLLFIAVFSMSSIYAQDISDALRFSQSEIQGTARFRALSGAFGALGGDLSAVSLNPASSAVFTRSHASVTGSSLNIENNVEYFGDLESLNNSDFNINQAGATFVLANKDSNSSWKKLSLSINYERTNNYDDNWISSGINTNSIDSYFFQNVNGTELSTFTPTNAELSQYFDINESLIENNNQLYTNLAYQFLGEVEGLSQQQNFLGFSSGIIEPNNIDDDRNTIYESNLGNGNFFQEYTYISTGYNGKITANIAAQYEEKLYIGLNLNSHFIDYERSTLLLEDNSNTDSVINQIDFKNTISTIGSGFSFQLGTILKLTPNFRAGLTYDSPTWLSIEEETTQYIITKFGNDEPIIIDPEIINILPEYKIKTPSKITGSLAYIFGKQGLISFDYSRKNYDNIKLNPTSISFFSDQNDIINNILTQASTYRIGGEYKYEQFSFRGGYRFEESPYKNGVTIGDLNGYSWGIGYNFGNTKLDFTFDESNQSFETPLFNQGLIETANIDRKNSNITLSLSFNL